MFLRWFSSFLLILALTSCDRVVSRDEPRARNIAWLVHQRTLVIAQQKQLESAEQALRLFEARKSRMYWNDEDHEEHEMLLEILIGLSRACKQAARDYNDTMHEIGPVPDLPWQIECEVH